MNAKFSLVLSHSFFFLSDLAKVKFEMAESFQDGTSSQLPTFQATVLCVSKSRPTWPVLYF